MGGVMEISKQDLNKICEEAKELIRLTNGCNIYSKDTLRRKFVNILNIAKQPLQESDPQNNQ